VTHDPCRHSCCVPPSSKEAVERYERGLKDRKRRLLQAITEAAQWERQIVVSYSDQDALADLIDDGLVINTATGYRPHPQ
jgi:hypothetical protein